MIQELLKAESSFEIKKAMAVFNLSFRSHGNFYHRRIQF